MKLYKNYLDILQLKNNKEIGIQVDVSLRQISEFKKTRIEKDPNRGCWCSECDINSKYICSICNKTCREFLTNYSFWDDDYYLINYDGIRVCNYNRECIKDN